MLEHITNPRLQTLGLRILGRHFPDALSPTQMARFAAYQQQVRTMDDTEVLVDFQGKKRMTPQAAMIEVEEIRKRGDLDQEQVQLLDEYVGWLNQKQ
jgi:hypothetical protein